VLLGHSAYARDDQVLDEQHRRHIARWQPIVSSSTTLKSRAAPAPNTR
jgi:hypothetical protein